MAENWLFGYGSILWKTGFPFEVSQPATVRNYSRRFWQASTDHRGTETQPGRVVTLVDAPGEVCWGIAYRLSKEAFSQVMEDLDHREKGGYDRMNIPLELTDGSRVNGVTYRASELNPHFLGHETEHRIAAQIATASGPSGTNKEYILRLHDTLLAHDVHDQHVKVIAELVMNHPGIRQ